MASVFDRTADVLERSAGLAAEHAERCLQLGRDDDATGERQAASRARDAAKRARLRAAGWHELCRELDELERGAEERDRAADERERVADERDRAADERERVADERERLHDKVESHVADNWALRSSGLRERSQVALRQADEALAFARARVSSLAAERKALEESAEE